MPKTNDTIVQLSRSLSDMKKGRIKYVPFDFKAPEKCYLCKKKTKLCKCIDCKFCGTLLKKNQICSYCKKRNTIKNFVINNAELNALEDLGVVDLKTMFKENREKEVEEWQERCKNVWHRLVREIDNPNKATVKDFEKLASFGRKFAKKKGIKKKDVIQD